MSTKKLEEENDSLLKQEKLNVINEYVANKEKKAKQLQEMKDSKKITLQDLKKEVRQARVKEKNMFDMSDMSDKPKKYNIRNRSKSVAKKDYGGKKDIPDDESGSTDNILKQVNIK